MSPRKSSPSKRSSHSGPQAFLEPRRSAFVNPFDDVVLLAYYHDLSKWHGYIRFLGLPHLKDNPDVPMESLYVEPLLAKVQVQPDVDPGAWGATVEPALEAIATTQRLVVLGDPGSGKSSLLSWITLQL